MEIIFEQFVDLINVLTGFLVYGKPVKAKVHFDGKKTLWIMEEVKE